jgi:osmotically-inducible protein OsmY
VRGSPRAGDPHEPAAGYERGREYGAGARANAYGQRRATKNDRRSDDGLTQDIVGRLIHASHVDPTNVSVDVKNGAVVLEGTVPERRMKQAIEAIVRECPEVEHIDNRIHVVRTRS